MSVVTSSGSRKTAIARAKLQKGTGKIYINNKPLEHIAPRIYRLRMQEPLLLAQDTGTAVDIRVRVSGGGMSSQADAARVAISRALVQHDAALENVFLDYDRLLLVADVRRKETHKPNRHGKARAKRQKSYR